MAQEQPDDSHDLFGYDPGARPPIAPQHLHTISSSPEESGSRIPPSRPSGGHCLDQLGVGLRDAFSRARKLAAERPAQTIAAIAGTCFALGVSLGLRSTHRR
jgi:hypothetical protein